MSDYHRLKCVDHEDEMDIGTNRDSRGLLLLVKHRNALLDIIEDGGWMYLELTVRAYYETVDMGWLRTHRNCKLIVTSEYDDVPIELKDGE